MKKLTIIKVGGKIIGNPTLLHDFLISFRKIEGQKLLVHGGGKVADQVLKSMGETPKMIEGRRITDDKTLEVVTMVYGGLVNKNLVAKMQQIGINAVGMSGADGNIIQSEKRPVGKIDYGFAGDVKSVQTEALRLLLEGDFCPVICPLTHDKNGQILNTNADTMAQEIAVALANHFEVSLRYCFEFDGVLKNREDASSIISEITLSKFEELKTKGIVADGMIPKLDNAFSSIERGVNEVMICGISNMHLPERATLIHNSDCQSKMILKKPKDRFSDFQPELREYFQLLANLIQTPSFSGKENKTGDLIEQFLRQKNIPLQRLKNNIIARNKTFDYSKKTIVLNSHHDTVKVNNGWTKDPFGADISQGKLYGLGSNDAGASLVSLIAVFCHLYKKDLPFNLVLIASTEEENFGPNGIKSVLPTLDFEIDFAIIGEPTEMQPAVAEKGLLVIDGLASGEAGHAARPNGKNAIDIAMKDIRAINKFVFEKESPVLGKTIKSVTQIEAGMQHNVIPDECRFVMDVRVNELYELQEVFEKLQSMCTSKLTARSFRNRPSRIAFDHPIVKRAKELGLVPFGSPTLSDQVHFDCPSLKIGPGRSERSHQADEFVFLKEIEEGIRIYIELLEEFEF